MKNVNLAKNPAGPFAPNKLSLLPLYAPSPIELDFCNKTAMVKTTAKMNCKTKKKRAHGCLTYYYLLHQVSAKVK